MDQQYVSEVKTQMLKALEIIKTDLSSVHTGRATSALVEHLPILAYQGSQTMVLREMANFTVSDATTLIIHPFDPSTKEDIVKGIMVANIGLNPIIDGEVIRITFPLLSEERRQEYIKLAHMKLEAGKVMVRQIRHQEMNDLRRSFENKEITEDDRSRLEKLLQEVTDEIVSDIDLLGKMKEKELSQV